MGLWCQFRQLGHRPAEQQRQQQRRVSSRPPPEVRESPGTPQARYRYVSASSAAPVPKPEEVAARPAAPRGQGRSHWKRNTADWNLIGKFRRARSESIQRHSESHMVAHARLLETCKDSPPARDQVDLLGGHDERAQRVAPLLSKSVSNQQVWAMYLPPSPKSGLVGDTAPERFDSEPRLLAAPGRSVRSASPASWAAGRNPFMTWSAGDREDAPDKQAASDETSPPRPRADLPPQLPVPKRSSVGSPQAQPQDAPKPQQQATPPRRLAAAPSPSPPPPPRPPASPTQQAAPKQPAPSSSGPFSAPPPPPSRPARASSEGAEPSDHRASDPTAHLRAIRVHTPRNEQQAMKLLGLGPKFSSAEVRHAYMRGALHWHPDRPVWLEKGDKSRSKATAAFRRIKVAHDLLVPFACDEAD
mmetsp:Transcript_13305/g.42964  ORF Transcript_13305/g.42964 Transcript_13305/m.42964 type:complete len:416 (+) Transcript_13305:446-1693(+)